MWVVSEGLNKHNMPISRDAMINAASSIIGKPVLFKYNLKSDDFDAHEEDEIACGVTALSKTDYAFKEDDDGKLWLVCKAYIWKMYYPEVVDIFVRDKKKSISMEILIVDSETEEGNETPDIEAFSFTGVTLLGDIYRPAIVNACATVEKFSEMVKETERLLFSNIKAEDNVKEVEEVTFNKLEFAQSYNYTVNEMFEEFAGQCSEKYMDGDYECKKYYVRDFCNQHVYASDMETGKCVAMPYSKDLKIDKAAIKKCRMTYVVDEIPAEQNTEGETTEPSLNLVFTKEEFQEKIKPFSEKIETINTEFEAEKAKFSEKITNLENINSELSNFKENILKQEREQQIQFSIESVKDCLTEEQITEWTEKAVEYDNVDNFKNAILAFAFTQTKQTNTNETTRIHIPLDSQNTEQKQGLWD
jgi:hypothetical protein